MPHGGNFGLYVDICAIKTKAILIANLCMQCKLPYVAEIISKIILEHIKYHLKSLINSALDPPALTIPIRYLKIVSTTIVFEALSMKGILEK